MPFIQVDAMETSEPLPGWKGRYWRSEQMSFAHYDFSEGASIHEHHHSNEEMWTVIQGELEVTIDGESAVATAGAVAVIPGDAKHSVRALTDGRAFVANHPVRHDLR